MTVRYFTVTSYGIVLGKHLWGTGRGAIIDCRDKQTGSLLSVSFWSDDESLPDNLLSIQDDKITGRIHVPAERYAWFLDMLRNESPVTVRVDDEDPEKTILFVREEPVGEGE